ncbi:aspartate aminotransferase family protein [Sediminispirochaeta bajacaliforniensis]|uniref:aspartate aminotransferase family protein n=1 Tax=Sediminispirochaeta bajacaliforniensis TaxID=148 RepID=UPI000366B150|nr:aspartate aminotransferase family protein [Sediminispirochaeta bajacaliforniensis]
MAHINSDKNSEYLGPEKIIGLKQEYLIPCSYHFYRRPPQIVQASGTKVYDSTGKVYTDFFAGVSVMSCGHCNPQINNRVIQQLNTLQHTTSIYLTQPVVELARRLAEILPGTISRSFFCNSGSEANESALLAARLFTQKRKFIAMEGSLHGRTFLTTGVTAIPMWRTDPFVDEVPVSFASDEAAVMELLRNEGAETAALIVEPIQGNGGIRPLPPSFFDRIAVELKRQGVLLISDEIQSGFGRSGKMFAIEHYPVEPDMITGAKALGNGFPIGFFAARPEIANAFTKPSASTLGGNPVSCTAGLAVLDFIKSENLVSRAAEYGDLLMSELRQVAKTAPFLNAPRGLGLMVGMEVRDYQGKAAADITDDILEAMKEKGFLIGKNGVNRNVLAFQPPLIIEKAEITAMADALEQTASHILG